MGVTPFTDTPQGGHSTGEFLPWQQAKPGGKFPTYFKCRASPIDANATNTTSPATLGLCRSFGRSNTVVSLFSGWCVVFRTGIKAA